MRDGKLREVLATPKVVELCKKHFGCDLCTGVELENDGGAGSAGSHWERSIMYNEMMTASDMYVKTVYSAFTMAVMEDSGWYQPNYEMAGLFPWGENEGCGFINNVCNGAIKYKKEFCYDASQISCNN